MKNYKEKKEREYENDEEDEEQQYTDIQKTYLRKEYIKNGKLYGLSELHQACFDGDKYKVVKLLDLFLKNKRRYENWKNNSNMFWLKTGRGETCFDLAAQNGHIEICEVLYKDGFAMLSEKYSYYDPVTSWLCYTDKFYKFYKSKREEYENDPNSIYKNLYKESSDALLSTSAFYGLDNMVSWLLQDPRVNPNETSVHNDSTAFYNACVNGHFKCAKLFMNCVHVDVNKGTSETSTSFYRPIHAVIDGEHIEILKLMLDDERVELNVTEFGGCTPFVMACMKNNIDMVKMMLQTKRLKPNIPVIEWYDLIEEIDLENLSMVPYVIEYVSPEILKLLLNDPRIDCAKPGFNQQDVFNYQRKLEKYKRKQKIKSKTMPDLEHPILEYTGETAMTILTKLLTKNANNKDIETKISMLQKMY